MNHGGEFRIVWKIMTSCYKHKYSTYNHNYSLNIRCILGECLVTLKGRSTTALGIAYIRHTLRCMEGLLQLESWSRGSYLLLWAHEYDCTGPKWWLLYTEIVLMIRLRLFWITLPQNHRTALSLICYSEFKYYSTPILGFLILFMACAIPALLVV